VVGGSTEKKQTEDYPEDIAEHVALLEESGMKRMDAIKACAKARGVPKNEIYNIINRKDDDTE